MAYIIGIGGVSRSGKSTMAQILKKKIESKRVLTLDMDDYVFPVSAIPKIKDHTDWEVPESVDFQKVITILDSIYDQYDLVIVEGILAFANVELNHRYDLTIMIEVSKHTFLKRRQMETRWGTDPAWYIEYVWEAHWKYGRYPEADLVVSGEQEFKEVDFDLLIKK